MEKLIAFAPRKLLRREATAHRHGLIDSGYGVVGGEDENQVWNGIEGLLPLSLAATDGFVVLIIFRGGLRVSGTVNSHVVAWRLPPLPESSFADAKKPGLNINMVIFRQPGCLRETLWAFRPILADG